MLGEIMLNDTSTAQGQLIKEGHGVEYFGGKR